MESCRRLVIAAIRLQNGAPMADCQSATVPSRKSLLSRAREQAVTMRQFMQLRTRLDRGDEKRPILVGPGSIAFDISFWPGGSKPQCAEELLPRGPSGDSPTENVP